jgi:nicotinate phosphoribosyltransferase
MKNSPLYTPRDFFAVAREEAEIDNILNNDVYKFLMLDFILANETYANTNVRWKMNVRDPNIHLAQVIPESALREQLDAAKSIKWITPADASFLRGMTNATTGKSLLREETIIFLETFRLPDYTLERDKTWNYELSFEGPWKTSMMWEILGLKIVNTLYLYHYIKKEKISNTEFTQIMTEMFHRLFEEIKIFEKNPWVTFSEFWTRRSASTDIQRAVLQILEDKLPHQCVGTSNVMLAREFGTANPRGTNAHELRMIPTALIDDPDEIMRQMYDIDRQWARHHPGLSILLPDTFWTTSYFKHAPRDIIENHIWCRFDSKDPLIAIPEYVEWLLRNGQDPKTKIGIPSDGLDAQTSLNIWNAHGDKLKALSFGIGTNLTNNTKWTWPRQSENNWPFWSFSVVVKPYEVQRADGTWKRSVKLSDNPSKATWDTERVNLFKKTFWVEGMKEQKVEV